MGKRLQKILTTTLLSLSLALAPHGPALAMDEEEKISIISDAEIEDLLVTFLRSMLSLSHFSPEKLNIILVNDPSINAAALPGGSILIHTGLLKTATLDEMLGVLAHEIGHLLNGDHEKRAQHISKAQYPMILGLLVGGALMAIRQSDAGAAAIWGGQHAAERSVLSHTRGEESVADKTALDILDSLKISSKGVVSILNKLASEGLRVSQRQNQYAMTHPVSADRVEFARNHLQKSPYANNDPPSHWQRRWSFAKAKLEAYDGPAEKVVKSFEIRNQNALSPQEKYTLALAYTRHHEVKKAHELFNVLHNLEPKNPYFYEAHGLLFFEHGEIFKSLAFYKKAMECAPQNKMFPVAYAHALIETHTPKSLEQAVALLEKSRSTNPYAMAVLHFLAMAYGRMGKNTESSLVLAEKALLEGKKNVAKTLATKILQIGGLDSSLRARAKDVILASELK